MQGVEVSLGSGRALSLFFQLFLISRTGLLKHSPQNVGMLAWLARLTAEER
jgi:hypothetical protein